MMSEPTLVMQGTTLGLGPLRRDLLDTYVRWVNDLRVTRTLGMPCRPYSREKQEAWLNQALVNTRDSIFTIYDLSTMRPIGNTGLHDIDHDNGTAEFGILIGETDTWGKGFGTEATRLMVGYGFDVLGLHNIYLQTYSNNPAGLKAYERAGFRRIGVRRGAKKIGRIRFDVILMDIVADDVEPSALAGVMHPPEKSS